MWDKTTWSQNHVIKFKLAYRYEGEWKNDKRHGRGTYRYTNGDVYIGEWSADMRHGKGEYHYVDEDMVYTGMWRHGRRSGKCD